MPNTALQALYTDPRLIFELAAQVEPPKVLAERYELDPQFLEEMLQVPQVKRLIAQKRKELDDAGYSLSQKAKLMFEDLLPTIYRKAKAEDISLSGVLSAAEFLRKVAGLDKQEVNANQGDKFSITINFSGAPTLGGSQAAVQVIDAVALPVLDLPDPPTYIQRVSSNELAYE